MTCVPLHIGFGEPARAVLGFFNQFNNAEWEVLVVADVSEIAQRELPLMLSPVLSTPATFAPTSVCAKSPIVVPEDTTATLNSTSVASQTYASMSEAEVLAM